MVEPGGDPDLIEEPLTAEDGREILAQHLEGNVPVVLGIPREIYRGHAAPADLALDAVAFSQRCLEPDGSAAH